MLMNKDKNLVINILIGVYAIVSVYDVENVFCLNDVYYVFC